ncbi:carbohydrate binding protein [Curtobacterium sp. PhB42]|uniref:carbohydrate binding domain-containing protein n=1 Tax=unclassified Curtobacterium TaxID=257496 RepID=UPI001062409F|nr:MULTISPECIES: carbohydrate binding domain-containing protein [unclassified Curtobacterium]TDW50999.1 carbohydrate binding protein [Curtobacterium sp. PhB42]TDW56155.1 carbohydrate binding protein [Curtobacterium sp. PhB190]
MTTTITIPALQTPVTHAWTGAANSSVSTESVGGVVQRRNLMLNPGFEAGTIAYWTSASNAPFTVGTALPHSGLYSAKYTASGDGLMLAGQSGRAVSAETAYIASAWVNLPNDLAAPFSFRVTFKNSAGASLGTMISSTMMQWATGGWSQISMDFTTPVGTATVDIYFMYSTAAKAGDTFYIDDAMLETPSTYTGNYFDGSTPTSYLGFSTSPLLVDGWTESAESRNIINPVLGGGVDVTPQAASKRSGSFVLVYQDEADAVAAFDMHRMATTFVLTDTDRPSVGMTYVLSGTVERTLDDESRDFWLVTVNYQEI